MHKFFITIGLLCCLPLWSITLRLHKQVTINKDRVCLHDLFLTSSNEPLDNHISSKLTNQCFQDLLIQPIFYGRKDIRQSLDQANLQDLQFTGSLVKVLPTYNKLPMTMLYNFLQDENKINPGCCQNTQILVNEDDDILVPAYLPIFFELNQDDKYLAIKTYNQKNELLTLYSYPIIKKEIIHKNYYDVIHGHRIQLTYSTRAFSISLYGKAQENGNVGQIISVQAEKPLSKTVKVKLVNKTQGRIILPKI